MLAQREYVVPQWVCDCANWRILIPCADYRPGIVPPPHLSPFVSKDDEGYTPTTRPRWKLRCRRKPREAGVADVSGDAGARMLTAEVGGGGARVRAGSAARGEGPAPGPCRGRDHADSEEEEGSEEEGSEEEEESEEENSEDEKNSEDETPTPRTTPRTRTRPRGQEAQALEAHPRDGVPGRTSSSTSASRKWARMRKSKP